VGTFICPRLAQHHDGENPEHILPKADDEPREEADGPATRESGSSAKPVDFVMPTREPSRMPLEAAQCCAIIPARDESGRIGPVVRGALRHVSAAWVVDDGSLDTTGTEARDAGARVLQHERPLGKGAALRSGWREAIACGHAWAVLLDGDGQHAPDDIPKLLAAAGEARPLVIGRRSLTPGVMPWARLATNRWLSRRISRLAGQHIPDSQSGFRVVHLPTLARLALHSRHFEVESEMCIAFARAGHAIVSVPIQTLYGSERSKVSPWRDGWRWWRWYRAARSRDDEAAREAMAKQMLTQAEE